MMSDGIELVFECSLDAPPEKVWRALSIPEYLARWLQPAENIELAVVTAEENKSLTYRWREAGRGVAAPAQESLVTFELTPNDAGGTWFKLTHAPMVMPVAANSNSTNATLMAA